jgi:hypothetical protein
MTPATRPTASATSTPDARRPHALRASVETAASDDSTDAATTVDVTESGTAVKRFLARGRLRDPVEVDA